MRVIARRHGPVQPRFCAVNELIPLPLPGSPIPVTEKYCSGPATTLQLVREGRFFFEQTDGQNGIRDRKENRLYTLVKGIADMATTEDYAIVSRESTRVLVSCSSCSQAITQYGTQAASEFATSDALLRSTAHYRTVRLEQKRCEILLHARVIGQATTPPDLIALDCR